MTLNNLHQYLGKLIAQGYGNLDVGFRNTNERDPDIAAYAVEGIDIITNDSVIAGDIEQHTAPFIMLRDYKREETP